MIRRLAFLAAAITLAPRPTIAHDQPPEPPSEAQVVAGFRAAVPADHYRPAHELHEKWLAIRAGKSRAVIVDARTQEEWDLGHIEGAVRVDFDHAFTIPERWPDPDQEIWVHCRLSKRSTYLAGLLASFGYRNVYVSTGGIAEWKLHGFPLVTKRFGRVIPRPRPGETLPKED